MSEVIGAETRPNFEAWDIEIKSSEQFWELAADRERYHYLCSLAHLAANSHNTQPWMFSYDENSKHVKFSINPQRVLPASDVVGRQAVISLGCAIANFSVAAEALGCRLEKKILIEEGEEISNLRSGLIDIIQLRVLRTESTAQINPDIVKMYQSIKTRRVDRGEYDHDRKLDPSLIARIQELGQNVEVKTVLISDWGRKVALAELQAQADSFVINNKNFATELVNDWMLENNSFEELGMPGDTFKLNDNQIQKIKFRFRNGMGFESDDATSIAQLGKKGILSCQCVGMLIVEKDTPERWLTAGEVLQRGALLFESAGVAWAVHAGLAEVSQVNRFMLRPIAMTSQRPVVLFRAGYLKATETRAPHSPRQLFEKVWREM